MIWSLSIPVEVVKKQNLKDLEHKEDR